ncbi:MAG: GAF domain-containing protein [Chloroflexota bacterium]|nr:GAF domain-containing protein [Chloroflexota bacterium]
MGTEQDRGMYLRFAAFSFAAIALGAATVAYGATKVDRSSQQQAAARSAANTVATPLGRIFEPLPADAAPPQDVIERAAATVQPLLSSPLAAVRVWSSRGTLLFTAGADTQPAVRPASGDLAWRRATAPDGRRLFVTYARAGSYTVEVDQTSSALDSSIAHDQQTILVLTAVMALVSFGLLQVSFRRCIAGLIARYRRLSHLYTTGDEIRSSLDLDEVITQLGRDAARLASADYALVALFDDASGELTLHAAFGRATDSVRHHKRAIDEWFMRRCVATNTTVVTLESGAGYRQFVGDDGSLDGYVHLLCVPVSQRNRVVGVISVLRIVRSKTSAFGATDTSQVQELAGQAVIAIEQAQLFAKVRGHAAEMELSYDATLKALMAALEAKDSATEGHGERLARLTVQLAKHMDVPQEQLIDLERGALLHDVGTIGIPDAILKKPYALNDGEWEAVRKHPLLASLMVSKIGFLENAMPILLYHHERYDGKGYPFGLTADKIPLEARMFSIVDAYDAMTSDRPYRDAMAHDGAMAEIAENVGTQFDPEVAAKFEELLALRPDLRNRPPPRFAEEAADTEATDDPADHAA